MKHIPNLLIVSGLGRNIGKTELASRIILRHSCSLPVYGIKVSVISPETSSLVAHEIAGSCSIFEETDPDCAKDTSRMMRAGAEKVFYLQAGSARVSEAFMTLLQQLPSGAALVCESNSLGDFFSAGLHLLIAGPEHNLGDYSQRINSVDLVIISDRKSGFTDIDRIRWTGKGWDLRPSC